MTERRQSANSNGRPEQKSLFEDLEQLSPDGPIIEHYMGATATLTSIIPAERELDPVEREEKGLGR